MAALANPFSERAAVLRAAGHDATSWERIEREWIQRIEQDKTGDLGLAFGQAFAQAKTGPNEDALDRTAELRALRTGPVPPFSALPFEPARPSIRRLHRFDTQTGLPLPSPYWSDDAKGSTDPTRSA